MDNEGGGGKAARFHSWTDSEVARLWASLSVWITSLLRFFFCKVICSVGLSIDDEELKVIWQVPLGRSYWGYRWRV